MKEREINRVLKKAKEIGSKSLLLIERAKDRATTNSIVFDQAAEINSLAKELYEILEREKIRVQMKNEGS